MCSAIRAAIEFLASDIPTALAFSALQGDVAKRHGYTMWINIAELQVAMVEDAVGVEGAAAHAMAIMDHLRAMGAVVWAPMWYAGLGLVKLLRGEVDAADRRRSRPPRASRRPRAPTSGRPRSAG